MRRVVGLAACLAALALLSCGLLWIDRGNFRMCKAEPAALWDADAELGRIVDEGAIKETICGDRSDRGRTKARRRAERAAGNCGYSLDDARRTIEFAGAERAAAALRCPR